MSTAAAETWQQSVVGLFREACVVPDTPTAMMAAGEKLASARDWKLDQEKSGRTSFIFMHQPPDPNGEPFFVTKIWDFSLPAAASIKAMILITGPEYPDVRYSICGFVISGNVAEEVASEIQRTFGASVIASSRTKPTPN